MKKGLLILLTMVSSGLFAAGNFQLRADSLKIEIGDHLRVLAGLEVPAGTAVSWLIQNEKIGEADLIQWGKADTSVVSGRWKITQPMTVSLYDSGSYLLGPMMVAAGSDTLFSETLLLEATTLLVDTAAPPRPIKAPLDIPYSWRELLPWILAGLGLIAAIALLWWYLKKRKSKGAETQERPRPKDLPHVWAEKELRKLDAEKLWQKDEIKLYYSRLTDILRLYLEYRFSLPAMENTTEEIRRQVMIADIPAVQSGRLLGILELADRVKFAKGRPGPEQFTLSMQESLAFVAATAQAENELKKGN
jgi:hypothetical protein